MDEISAEVLEYIASVIEDDVDRKRDHLAWLATATSEPGREQQIAETTQAIALAERAAKLFPFG